MKRTAVLVMVLTLSAACGAGGGGNEDAAAPTTVVAPTTEATTTTERPFKKMRVTLVYSFRPPDTSGIVNINGSQCGPINLTTDHPLGFMVGGARMNVTNDEGKIVATGEIYQGRMRESDDPAVAFECLFSADVGWLPRGSIAYEVEVEGQVLGTFAEADVTDETGRSNVWVTMRTFQ